MLLQIKRDALFGSDGATSVKRKKIFPSAETPCTSPAPDMAEDARPSTSSGGPAGIETPGSISMWLDVDVTPELVPTGQGGEAGSASSSTFIAAQGSMASLQPAPSGSGYQSGSSSLDKRKVPCTKCSDRRKKIKSLQKKHNRLQKKFEKLREKYNQHLLQQVSSIHYLVMRLYACNFNLFSCTGSICNKLFSRGTHKVEDLQLTALISC